MNFSRDYRLVLLCFNTIEILPYPVLSLLLAFSFFGAPSATCKLFLAAEIPTATQRLRLSALLRQVEAFCCIP